jgi:serine/threonine-protein kinase
MTLTPGTSLGAYEVLSALGAGGMGEVYRATDTNLGRQVAIKVLPDVFARDPERLARFEREARTLAALNHPHIAQIYGLEKSSGVQALVMELVEGEDLSERVARGAIPLDEALPIARQIAEALEAAHEHGIVHRDLKPANIKVRPDGTVKVLDFGLAKAMDPLVSDVSASVTHAQTVASPALMTAAATIVGTAAYMSPEQARGRPVDKRADIWAFGCVLYEMLTGQRAFAGEDVAETLGAVIHREPAWQLLPATVSPLLASGLRRCLNKNPKQRVADMQDVRLLLEGAFDTAVPSAPVAPRRGAVLPWAIAAILAVVAGSALLLLARRDGADSRPRAATRLSVDLGERAQRLGNLVALISPDGTRLVHAVRANEKSEEWVYAIRRLDQTDPVILTAGSGPPFWSPDSKWVGFFDNGAVMKIPADGGVAVRVGVIPYSARGGSWSHGLIVVGTDTMGLLSMPEAGGDARPLTTLEEGELTHAYPQVLPNGEAVLFTANSSKSGFEDARIKSVSVTTGQQKTIVTGAHFGRFVPSGMDGTTGHLLYLHEGVLYALPFDPVRLERLGDPVAVLKDVSGSRLYGSGLFGASNDGTLVFGQGFSDSWRIEWLDQAGQHPPLIQQREAYTTPRFSPDGARLAVVAAEVDGQQIHIFDVQREVLTRLTTGMKQSVSPVWSPDGRHLVFSTGSDLYWIRADGGGMPHRLLAGRGSLLPTSMSPDGRWLAYTQSDPRANPKTSDDVWIVSLDTSDQDRPTAGAPQAFVQTPATESEAMFSPDGRWVAYSSTESGTKELYVRPFPGQGSRLQLSAGGGQLPMWSKSNHQIVYLQPEPASHVMVVDYDIHGETFAASKPRQWTDAIPFNPGLDSNLDLAPDGKRLAILGPPDESLKGNLHATFMFNFFDELRRLAPLPSR